MLAPNRPRRQCALILTVQGPESGVLSLSVAMTVRVCMPAVSFVVSSRYEKPTFGHPGRPGKTAHTSARFSPYVAVPTFVPSTSTCTELIAVPALTRLSNARPLTGTAPVTAAPAVGESMYTPGGIPTVMLTLADPVSGVPSLSVADTVMVCGPDRGRRIAS